ncbi:MAG: histidinol dehydrogenase [Pseudomonadota bacterium]
MIRLSTSDSRFERDFAALVNARREADADVARDVRTIIASVRDEGDAALHAFTKKFDRHDLNATGWRIEKSDWLVALDGLDPALRAALELAAERIATYHLKQKPEDSDTVDSTGARLGARWNAIQHAGIYIPGGRAAYPSSVLMNAIPARVAGVERLVMVTPTPDGEVNPLVLAAAHIAGVDEVWRIGGAQAIAALAYGTGRIKPVDVITGPGNAWVAEAKRQLYGVVGIDMVAGPSEIVVVADGKNDPEWIAADLLSQAEHDPTSQSILFTDDADFARAVADAVDLQIGRLETAQVARASWDANGAIIVSADLAEAMPLVDRLAPEHLELACDDPQALFDQVRHAGSVFLGRHTPEAIGDYVAGPNHVLPTGRRARFASGLSVLDFMKRTSFLQLDHAALSAIGPAAVALAEAEGLPAHARSVALRLAGDQPEFDL